MEVPEAKSPDDSTIIEWKDFFICNASGIEQVYILFEVSFLGSCESEYKLPEKGREYTGKEGSWGIILRSSAIRRICVK